LRDMSSTLAQGAAGVPNYLSGSSPGRLERRVLREERGKCYSRSPLSTPLPGISPFCRKGDMATMRRRKRRRRPGLRRAVQTQVPKGWMNKRVLYDKGRFGESCPSEKHPTKVTHSSVCPAYHAHAKF